MSWQSVGERTFVPGDRVVIVGDFSLGSDHDTVWVRITSLSPPTPWPWSYGILGWRSSDGYELGSVKAYSEQLGEVFRLGVGLSPLQRDGQFTFEPRAYNLAWIQQGNPWTLRFEAQSGFGSSPPEFPGFGTRATLGVLADSLGVGIPYNLVEGFAYLALSN
jgi:hypothetical protein